MTISVSISRLIRSPGLAVALFLALAALAAVGTIAPPPAPDLAPAVPGWKDSVARIIGLQSTFRSPLFLSLVAMFVINVFTCTVHRLSSRLRTSGVGLRGVTDVMIHASLVLLVLGGLAKVLFGFVGTQNIYVGESTRTVYDWKAGRDAPLGFAIGIDDFQTSYFPIRAKIGIRRAVSGEKVALLEVVEGTEVTSPGDILRLAIAGYDPGTGFLRLEVTTKSDRQVLVLDTAGEEPAARSGEYDLVLVAYRADIRNINATISLQEPGSGARGKSLGTNDRIVYRGLSLFLTAWGTDPEGRKFCGIQVARDPGAPIFWAGCVFLALAIPLHILAKKRSW